MIHKVEDSKRKPLRVSEDRTPVVFLGSLDCRAATKCNMSRHYGRCFSQSIACMMRRNNAVEHGESTRE